ncbi:hypothetical protein PG993_012530 [Apiospora rasikravindrae]|uniref:Uncharacterized protein n=1 Tax=Apiospora rasikravindrae TaxID=990691 RepID=A0ABR1S2R3_9PEZI
MMQRRVDGHRLGLTQGHTVSTGSLINPPNVEAEWAAGKRKALAKKAEEASSTKAGTLVKSEPLVECWDMQQQSVSMVPASRTKQLYNARTPLMPSTNSNRDRQRSIVFPLSPDHLITLLQYNVLRALAVNRTLISGILSTPLDCIEESIHVLSYRPADPSRPLLPPSLVPTTLQQTVLHGDWVDIFPCPSARDRVIRAAGTFDEDELWADCIGGMYEGFPDDEVERRGSLRGRRRGTFRGGRCRRGS